MQKKQIIGLVMLSAMFLILSATFYGSFVMAADQEVPGTHLETALVAGTPKTYRFQMRTQLRLNSSQNLDLVMDCDAANIGDQVIEIDIESSAPGKLTMNCTETQAELGLMKGETVQTRTQTRTQLGFCANLSLNVTLTKAQLKIQIKDQNKVHVWARYDVATGQWVEVPTTVVNGYAVAETTSFSTWTVLTSDSISGFLFVLPISAAAIIALAVLQKRRHK